MADEKKIQGLQIERVGLEGNATTSIPRRQVPFETREEEKEKSKIFAEPTERTAAVEFSTDKKIPQGLKRQFSFSHFFQQTNKQPSRQQQQQQQHKTIFCFFFFCSHKTLS